jgi:hypothetical protein
MSDTPTPRTHAALLPDGEYRGPLVWAETAPQLERELAEAKETIAMMETRHGATMLYHQAQMDDCVKIFQRAEQLQRELAEAMDDAEAWKREAQISEARLRGEKHQDDNGIVSPSEIVTKLHIELDEVTKQRDALAEALLEYVKITQPGVGMQEMSKIGGRLLFYEGLRECRKIAEKALAATKGGGL